MHIFSTAFGATIYLAFILALIVTALLYTIAYLRRAYRRARHPRTFSRYARRRCRCPMSTYYG